MFKKSSKLFSKSFIFCIHKLKDYQAKLKYPDLKCRWWIAFVDMITRNCLRKYKNVFDI